MRFKKDVEEEKRLGGRAKTKGAKKDRGCPYDQALRDTRKEKKKKRGPPVTEKEGGKISPFRIWSTS